MDNKNIPPIAPPIILWINLTALWSYCFGRMYFHLTQPWNITPPQKRTQKGYSLGKTVSSHRDRHRCYHKRRTTMMLDRIRILRVGGKIWEERIISKKDIKRSKRIDKRGDYMERRNFGGGGGAVQAWNWPRTRHCKDAWEKMMDAWDLMKKLATDMAEIFGVMEDA